MLIEIHQNGEKNKGVSHKLAFVEILKAPSGLLADYFRAQLGCWNFDC